MLQIESQPQTAAAQEMGSRYGSQIALCYQCKKCTSGCPVADAMDLRPHQVVRLLQLGNAERALQSSAIWTCVGCYLCAARCPQGVPVTDLMYSLKGIAIKQGMMPRKATVPAFLRAFSGTVERYGRIRELPMLAGFYLSTDIREAIKHRDMGLQMLRQGRLPILGERHRSGKAVKAMLRKARSLKRSS
ncbi:MAG: 4Fe-4S dicluster domain-containing protein [Chloroflexi bacterium]|nr:4Fe-4S dicluster domain-containing protein [Chloroflexota bacterium]